MSLFLFPCGQLDRLILTDVVLTLTGTGARPRTAAAAVLHVGRLVEDRVTRAEGPRDARHWTKVIADYILDPGMGPFARTMRKRQKTE